MAKARLLPKNTTIELINSSGADECRERLRVVGLTQYQLARVLGTDVVTVNRWCTGKKPFPQYARAYLVLLEAYHKDTKVTRRFRLDEPTTEAAAEA